MDVGPTPIDANEAVVLEHLGAEPALVERVDDVASGVARVVHRLADDEGGQDELDALGRLVHLYLGAYLSITHLQQLFINVSIDFGFIHCHVLHVLHGEHSDVREK